MSCFLWYIYQDEYRLLDDQPTQILKLWLFDPDKADSMEQKNTATSPAVYSSILSKQFWNLGQEPSIRTLYTGMEYYSQSFVNGTWTFELPSETNDNIATIIGKTVTFQDCFVQDISFSISHPIYKLGSKTGISVTLPHGMEPMVDWHSCYPRSAVISTVDGLFHTSNGFLNVDEIKFPPNLVPSSMIKKVRGAKVFYPNVLILIENMLYQARIGEVINIGNIYFPNIKIIGIQAQTWCSGEYPLLENELSGIIIWSQDKVFLGYPGNKFHQLITVGLLKEKLKLQRTANLSVVYACYDSLIASIAILIECTGCLRKKILHLVIYKEDTQLWILKEFSLDLPAFGSMHMEVMPSALTSMILWDDDNIYYTYYDHKYYGYLQDFQTKVKFSAKSRRTKIHQIAIDFFGNVIIKLQNNELFFFKFEVEEVLKLTPWENEHKKFLFYFNPSGDMFLVTINGTKINRQEYPLKLEVLSSAAKVDDVCPFIAFENNLNLQVHYIDMGDKVTFWGQIVFLENKGLSVSVEIYRPELLKTKELIIYEIARGICTKNKTVTFYHETDYSELLDYQLQLSLSKGVMTFEFQPSETGNTCLTKPMLSHIYVGCPPWKKIIVSNKSSDCENFTFTIPWLYLRDKSHKKDKEVIFDVNKYGCPIQIHYTQDFLPRVEIYVDEKTLKPVDANYILWEMSERTDFVYKASMEKILCLHAAQTWEEMIKLSNKSIETTEDISEIWGPHNYRSCFIKRSGLLRKLDKKYEILNRSGLNYLTWPQHSSTYIFKLIIVDPNFSFCNLSTYFAVQTYGIVPRPSWIHVVGWSIFLMTLFWGALLYSYFRYVKVFRAFPFVDPLMSLRHVATAEKVYDQEKKK
ncbi:cation channel sperm-associated auxiliary subunit epsilon-like [Erythrolamprus reginae]|uniref:cation channel sperm-associated auxiliary subunit epsilon-like n=1 Tax=Erythrolamprus reginae TaxID=121349 RepID=UPI00396CE03F